MVLRLEGHSTWLSMQRPLDKRRKQPNPRITSDNIKQQIYRHIKSFPTIESHSWQLKHHYLWDLSSIDTLFFFSGSCPGKNMNFTVIQYLYSLVKMGLFQKIQHIFPIRGHSFLPSDRDFAKTESKKKKVDRLYLPNDWINVICSAKKVVPVSHLCMTFSLISSLVSRNLYPG